jgi:D-amino peptidase
MRVYISADIEGVSGVVHTAQSAWQTSDYERARKWMAKDVNAAVEGALQAGAEEIVVNDAHGNMRNLIIDDLHPQAKLISGRPKAVSMLHRLDGGFDLVFFVGYHARNGSRFGIINHTYSGSVVNEVRLNGKLVGEIGLNAATAAELNVPVGLVTGDKETEKETLELLPDVETVVVKEGSGRYAALCLHPARARELIKDASKRAVERYEEFESFVVEVPVRMELKMRRTPMADACELIPHVQRIDGVTVAYEAESMVQAYKLLQAFVSLAAASRPSPH